MKKTALQEAFSLLEELHPSFFDIHTEKGRTFVNTFHKFLDLEKEQIIDAQENGFTDGCRYTTGYEQTLWYDGEQYYNETFKQ